MNNLLEQAISFALSRHKGQVDKANNPYILHLLRVSLSLLPNKPLAVVGVLHDVIEDGHATEKELTNEFGKEIARLVMILTRRPDEHYMQTYENVPSYIDRVCQNYNALLVKLADINDHLSNINDIPDQREEHSLRKRYERAKIYLEKALVDGPYPMPTNPRRP